MRHFHANNNQHLSLPFYRYSRGNAVNQAKVKVHSLPDICPALDAWWLDQTDMVEAASYDHTQQNGTDPSHRMYGRNGVDSNLVAASAYLHDHNIHTYNIYYIGSNLQNCVLKFCAHFCISISTTAGKWLQKT